MVPRVALVAPVLATLPQVVMVKAQLVVPAMRASLPPFSEAPVVVAEVARTMAAPMTTSVAVEDPAVAPSV